MKIAAAEIDPRYICRYVIDQFTISESRACTRGEAQRSLIDRSDESTSQEHTCRCRSIEEVMGAERCDHLERKKTKSEPNPDTYRRHFGSRPGDSMIGIRLCGEVNKGFDDQGGRNLGSISSDFQDTSRPKLRGVVIISSKLVKPRP